MTTKVKRETHEEFQRRMDVERQELGRAIREQKYVLAASLAAYILRAIQERIDD